MSLLTTFDVSSTQVSEFACSGCSAKCGPRAGYSVGEGEYPAVASASRYSCDVTAGDCIAATAFGVVHGAVGILQQRLRIATVVRVQADAQAGPYLKVFTIN